LGDERAALPELLAEGADQVGVLGEPLDEDRPGAFQRRPGVGHALGDEARGRLGRVERRVAEQLVGQRLQPQLAGDLRFGAPLRLVGQVDVFEAGLGLGRHDLRAQLVVELALRLDRLQDRGPALVELAEVAQPLFERAQLGVVEAAGHLFAVARDERHGRAAVEQLDRGPHLPLAHPELFGDPLVYREHLPAFRWSRRSIVQDAAVSLDQCAPRVTDRAVPRTLSPGTDGSRTPRHWRDAVLCASLGFLMRISETDIPALARGCAVLGTGGGGDVRAGSLAAVRAIETYGPVPLVRLADLPPDALVVPLSGIGAPTVSHEMLHGEDEPVRIAGEVERLFGRPPAAVMSSEIGGSNGVAPVAWAAQLGLPLLDADGMGRAFPEVQMVSMYVAGLPADLVIMSDVAGNVVTIRPVDGLWSERLARAVCVASGSSALMADYVLTAERARGAVIEGTVTRALEIG